MASVCWPVVVRHEYFFRNRFQKVSKFSALDWTVGRDFSVVVLFGSIDGTYTG